MIPRLTMAFDDFKAAVLITGGTGGIGLHCAQQIASQRPDLLIVVASRVSVLLVLCCGVVARLTEHSRMCAIGSRRRLGVEQADTSVATQDRLARQYHLYPSRPRLPRFHPQARRRMALSSPHCARLQCGTVHWR